MQSRTIGSIVLLFLPPLLAAQVADRQHGVTIDNWAAPRQVLRSQLQTRQAPPSPKALAGNRALDSLIFVPVAPCRVADTRSGSGFPALGATALLGLTARSLPVAGSCGIPGIGSLTASPEAYSFNVTVVPPGGTPGGYLVMYPNPAAPVPLVASLTWNAGAAFQTAAVVVASSSDGTVNVAARFPTDVVIDINGYYASPSDQRDNTGLGFLSLAGATTGARNTAFGSWALPADSTGSDNTAIGFEALANNTAGSRNTALGGETLTNNSGAANTAVGFQALGNNGSGAGNTAAGDGALAGNASGSNNTALGESALGALTTGQNNTALGAGAGALLTTGNFNITIGHAGSSADDHVIRIGDTQTAAFIAGIYNNPLSLAATVAITANGQLGIFPVVVSSRRYKEDIQDMGDASSGLLRLRPVTFHYKKANPDGSKPLQFGLIAEEVNDVFPGLVVRGADGRVETVEYQKLPALLLNELQKQYRRANEQAEAIQMLESRLAALEALVTKMTSGATAGSASLPPGTPPAIVPVAGR